RARATASRPTIAPYHLTTGHDVMPRKPQAIDPTRALLNAALEQLESTDLDFEVISKADIARELREEIRQTRARTREALAVIRVRLHVSRKGRFWALVGAVAAPYTTLFMCSA